MPCWAGTAGFLSLDHASCFWLGTPYIYIHLGSIPKSTAEIFYRYCKDGRPYRYRVMDGMECVVQYPCIAVLLLAIAMVSWPIDYCGA